MLERSRDAEGSVFTGILLALAVVLILVAGVLPLLFEYGDEHAGGKLVNQVLQEKTVSRMRAIAVANSRHFAETGEYPRSLATLERDGYLEELPSADGWGNPWVYASRDDAYTLTSLGADGSQGPVPPDPWGVDAFSPDIVLVNGEFSQAPELSGRASLDRMSERLSEAGE